MGYIGTKPADAALTSADIADGVVTAAKLATDSVETAKVKDLNVSAGKLAATQDLSTKTITLPASVSGLGTGITAGQLTSTLDISSKTLTLPASVSGLGTGITNAQLAGSIDVTSKITGTVPTTNLGSGSASSATVLYGDQTYKAEPTTDLTPVRQDILTLALKQAVQENSTKFNLTNSAITKFEADADFNLAGSTDISRNASEYISSVSEGGNDSYAKVMLHGDEDPLVDSSGSSHTLGLVGSIARSSTQSKFGSYSISFNGSSQRITFPDHADWDMGTADWTIDWWFYKTSSGKQSVFETRESGTGFNLETTTSNYLHWYDSNDTAGTGAAPVLGDPSVHTLNTWIHYAIERLSTTVRLYRNGVIVDTQTGADGDMTSASRLYIGSNTGPSNWLNGYMEEFRWSKGIARYSGTGFTPETSAYAGTIASATGTALGTTNVPSSAVTEVSGVMLLKHAYGANTLGTDVKVYFTADNSNWTEVTSGDFSDAGTFSTGIKMIKLAKKTVTSGSDVRWKIVFANQASSSLVAEIYGIGLNY